MPSRARHALFGSALAMVAACGSESSQPPPVPSDPATFAEVDKSCAYACSSDPCAELAAPYACQNLGDWSAIPHAESCAAWDGHYPTPAQGQCSASAPTAEALKPAGPDGAGHVLPDGRHVQPSGAEWMFDEADLNGGMPSALAIVRGTTFVIEVDLGPGDHAVRVVDASKIGAGNPVVAHVKFARPETLNGGVAFVAPDLVLVASDDGVVHAMKLDVSTGALTRDDARAIALPKPSDTSHAPPNWYASGLAVSPDGAHLVVTGVFEKSALVYDVTPGASYGKQLGAVDLGAAETFGVFFDPADAMGTRAYVAMWGTKSVVEIDLTTPAMPKVARRFTTDANPQGIAFLDARWMAVANDLGETVSLVDRMSATVTSVPVELEPGMRGLDVSGVAYDASAKRLYASLSGLDAIAAYDVDLAQTPPALTPAGRLQTSWWPGGVAVAPDGAVVIASMRGYGKGPVKSAVPTSIVTDTQNVRGGVQRVPRPSASDLADGDARVRASVAVGALAGYPTVTCPAGVKDFPVPATNTEGPSPSIKHLFFVVRENKTYDALFGDLGANGDATLTMKATTAGMDEIWPNIRALAKTFARSDNFYASAIRSSQGHMWTAYGRTTDFTERTWGLADIVGRSNRGLPTSGIGAVGQPIEGSLFDWLDAGGVTYDILGEFVGAPKAPPAGRNPIDAHYPGGPIQSIDYHDGEKACYVAGRARVLCDLESFVYMTLPNDHAFGVDPSRPSPESMVAVNDDATGILVDAIAHSPLWSSSLIVITEDDPQQGADHVDYHRAPLVLVSPWVKRGYVSSAHIDVASLHKIFAHVLGLPYPNVLVKNAPLPFDLFTSTPDYTPPSRIPRKAAITCGGAATRTESLLTQGWDFSEVDEQPGHDAQIMRWMRGAQLNELTTAQRAELEARRPSAPWRRRTEGD
jgi:DNA-binding beta-propeller fold protein YncE